MHRTLGCLGVTVMLGACGLGADGERPATALAISFVKSQDYDTTPKESLSQVKLFTIGRPDRKFTEVGIISVKDTSYERVVWFARQRAARLGCDALYQVESSKVVTGMTVSEDNTPAPRYRTVGRFACLIWDD